MYMKEENETEKKKVWEATVRKTHLQAPTRRRGCAAIFVPTPIAPDDAAGASPELRNPGGDSTTTWVERQLPGGDSYAGDWSGGAPHGTGRYVWSDGCMYDGSWRSGRIAGRGKFSWPSGASYDGEFRPSGIIDGAGTFTSGAGTYRGGWSMNQKHGRGRECYPNGDRYEGDMRSGAPEGAGRYTWRGGGEYVGQWRSGRMHGKGSMTWVTGECYDGTWDSGEPRGSGSFRWPDGSLYVGFWSKVSGGGELQQTGVYYPSPESGASPAARDPRGALESGVPRCEAAAASSSGEVFELLSQKAAGFLWSRRRSAWDDEDEEDEREDEEESWDESTSTEFTDTATTATTTSSCSASDSMTMMSGGSNWEAAPSPVPKTSPRKQLRCCTPPPAMSAAPAAKKKQGETISKGHRNYELTLNLQLGIRHAVGKQAQSASLELKASAFDPKEKVWTKFPPDGSKHTPPHQSCDFKWKDYCPLVFRALRRLFKVDPGDYMMSLCGNEALRELSSPGKSGSFFYLSQDDRYMIKTMRKAETKLLIRILPAYYNHVRAFENTLVTKFYGLHSVKLAGPNTKKVRFVIMGNLFFSDYPIHRRFDLKGSSHGRTADADVDEHTTLKDLDLNFVFRLHRSWFLEFQRQIDRDCEFLEHARIMDYSLLVGLHFRDLSLPIDDGCELGRSRESTPRRSRTESDAFGPSRWASIRLGANMPARVEHVLRRGNGESSAALEVEPTGEFYDVVLFFGIIDILQDYDISKKLEHAYKAIQYDPSSISAVDPKLYSRRFRDFIFRVFSEDC